MHHYQCLCLLSLLITQSLEQGLPQGADLVLAGGEQVEQGDDGALELGAAAGVDGGREKLFQTIVSQIVSMKR